MTFTYNNGVPARPNNPSVDQPDMLSNTHAIHDIWEVDHVGFNAQHGGTHLQTSYFTKNPPGAQGDPASVAFTNDGVANATHPQYYWKNSQGIFPLSAIRAFGVFTVVASGAITMLNQFNILSSAVNSPFTQMTITLNSNTTNTDNVVVFINTNDGKAGGIKYTFASNVLSITLGGGGGVLPPSIGSLLSFIILQI